MSAILLDTSSYTALLRSDDATVDLVSAADEIHLPVIVLGELLAGFAAGSRAAENRDDLGRFMASPRVHVMAVDARTPRFYAETYLALRLQGTPIPTNDLWIAALARQHRVPVLSRDAHFGRVPGLRLAGTPGQGT